MITACKTVSARPGGRPYIALHPRVTDAHLHPARTLSRITNAAAGGH